MSGIGGIGRGMYIAPPRPVRRTKPVGQQDQRGREEPPEKDRRGKRTTETSR